MLQDCKPGCTPYFTSQVRNSFCFFLVIICVGFSIIGTVETHDEAKMKGHLQAFGESGTRKEIEVRQEFPEPYEFLVHYVQKLKPLKLRGVTKKSRAVREWTDDYLLALDVPEDSVVQLETKKKENRQQETTEMHFHDFLRTYNKTEHYMVDDIPSYLSPDVMVPCSLQCPEMMEKGLAFAMMWFSSGGTKSVIHTDGFGNINCVIRGKKDFVLMDPARDREKIKLRTNGAYSDIDVDSVDLTMYPKLADAEFYHVHMETGDCLYIPFQWIHQVRSHNSNVAINFWWNHYSSTKLLEEEKQGPACQGHCDPNLTLDKVKLHHDNDLFEDSNAMRTWSKNIVLNNPLTLTSLMDHVKEDFNMEDLPAGGQQMILQAFERLDLDHDGEITKEEHEKIPMEIWQEILEDFQEFSSMLEDDEVAQRREYAEYVEADRRDEL
ncbi:hypothetical protein ACOMHN_059760 [Nucella lapillus]